MPVAAGLYYFSHGVENPTRLPVVLIHGAGGTHLYWPPEVRRLGDFRVYAVDLPGHGKSGGTGCQTIGDYARHLVAFLDEVGIYKAVFVGHSMGGAIALSLALDHARRTAGLGLVATGARLRVASVILENTARPELFPSVVKTLNEWVFGPHAEPRLKELAARRMAETRPAVLHSDFLACDAFDVMNRLGEIKAPALVLCGTEDKMTPLKYSQTLASLIPRAALQIIDGAGHMVMLEQPRRVATLLGFFLTTVPYTPGA